MVIVIIFTNIADFIYTKKTFLVPLLFDLKEYRSELLPSYVNCKMPVVRWFFGGASSQRYTLRFFVNQE